MTQRRVDKEKIERATREAKIAIEGERLVREAKTARLRQQRLAREKAEPSAKRLWPNEDVQG
ncbi:hypothetical protein [Mesorhizobium sp. INR15]|uniref:hypothetical protein n=1 Tax=Mesorhizobium sp. INR15 TaxID=2654248 RepID=UPI0018964FFB|nr:hypothetical protein [Mesorhizobium sp. INR15]